MSSYEKVVHGLSDYAKANVESVLKQMLYEVFLHTPEDPIQFMIDYLTELKEHRDNQAAEEDEDNDGEEAQNTLSALPVLPPSGQAGGRRRRATRRSAVSSEPISAAELASEPSRVIAKSEQDRAHIRKAVAANILFNDLEEEEMSTVISAMDAKEFKAGEFIIRQGDAGNSFYILEQGVCECFLLLPSWDEPRCVKTYEYGESFGELALMYNAPRAASIVAKTDVKVWEMDRATFRKVLLKTTSEKRTRYEGFLTKVPLLSSLDKYERSKVSDALVEVSFRAGECIIAQGDVGHNLYFIKSGRAVATKVLPGSDEPREVMHYKDGDYFGELALLHDAPRAANIFAVTDCKCVYVDREDFNRLLGPCDQILKRNKDNYQEIEHKIAAQKLRGDDNIDAEDDETDKKMQQNYQRRRRHNVFSEPMEEVSSEDFKPVIVPKTEAQTAAIRKSTANNFLFQALDPDSLQIVIDAMVEKKYQKGECIIKQGDEGDFFYILHSGHANCFVLIDGADKLVKRYSPGESFGELALMYNSPRAASIYADTNVTVFGVDRRTFHRVIMDTANQKRKLYEDFLRHVPLLESLDDYERKTVADALESVTYSDGEHIITEGDMGDNFYIVEKGEAIATKQIDNSADPVEVYRYKPGGFFGELALLNDQPRAANVIAVGEMRCVHLDRSAFTRLLGPLDDILARQKKDYEDIENKLKSTDV